MAKDKTLKELVLVTTESEQDFDQLQKKILKIDIGQLASEGFLQPFLDNFKNFESRETIFKNILDKIRIFEAEHDANKSFNHIVKLKAGCLAAMGEDIYNNPVENEVKEMKFLRLQKSVSHLESANKLYQDLKECSEQVTTVKNLINKIITNYGDLEEGFKLALYSLQQRESNFESPHLDVLEAQLTLAKLGTESKIYNTKIEGLKCAELTYNKVCNFADISENAHLVFQALDYMSNIYSSLGDQEKASELSKKAAYVMKKFELAPMQESSENSKENSFEVEARSLILQKGITDYSVLKIKQLLQESILNPIQKAAANGKWHDVRYFVVKDIDYGVAGYLEEGYLKYTLRELCSEENYKIALGLCFEAINLGIMGSHNKNPLTAAIFCQQYPDLIQEIIKTHPEYFVDGKLLQTSLINSHIYTEKLLGTQIVENAEYNRFFEEAIIPLIKARLETSIFNPIKALASKGDWSAMHSKTLQGYLTEDYLMNSVLGNNLSKIPDVISIVRILAFNALREGIETSNSVNFASIQKFIELYPDLNIRIIDNHPEYLTNQFIAQICDNAKKLYIAQKLKEIIDKKDQGNISEEDEDIEIQSENIDIQPENKVVISDNQQEIKVSVSGEILEVNEN
ncbi:hypothetical protein Trichorick_01333 [Candidatus Trichorickettsia mobilis]|uniref:Uncharacterized protein n=1 Tax=Candidatus Trichorickettsia mobilis TaxID=1346319 RepID=A0ABZ0UV94_9RICK|nr:hypothetical protein [Candidatus Trichorickettsia mobilis]WPY01421.1 hypothetical protein Trichorick_01333 [Candidatus Trichorickettsia mobilis]